MFGSLVSFQQMFYKTPMWGVGMLTPWRATSFTRPEDVSFPLVPAYRPGFGVIKCPFYLVLCRAKYEGYVYGTIIALWMLIVFVSVNFKNDPSRFRSLPLLFAMALTILLSA